MVDRLLGTLGLILCGTMAGVFGGELTYPIVDTGQAYCFGGQSAISYPKQGQAYFGQDAQYNGLQPRYRDNGDGTVSDLNTGLMWQQSPGNKTTLLQARNKLKTFRLAGHTDWRVPTIKELYSLILFSGTDTPANSRKSSNAKPFIDQKYFKFRYGDPTKGERVIDSQYGTDTIYTSLTMGGNPTLFGVNFADGRIKGYPMTIRGRVAKTFFFLYVRGNPDYGKNQFVDNGDGTVTDRATGLMWMQVDSGHLKAGNWKMGGLNWKQALQWSEDLTYAGHSDWRLPNAKELHSIADYTRCPDKTNSGAIDPIFKVTSFRNEGGKVDFPFYWSSTTHKGTFGGITACYLAVGRGLGFMRYLGSSQAVLQDVHGAGCQRTDPKSGDPSRYPQGRGPQGDVIRIYNFVRCVRGGVATPRTRGPALPRTGSYQQRGQRSGSRSGQPGGQMGGGQSGQMQGGQMSGRQGGKPSFVSRLDKDGDGKVSKQEFDGPANHFSQLDKNGDGYLSDDETPQGPPQGQQRR